MSIFRCVCILTFFEGVVISAVCALHYCVIGFLGYCVFALYTKDEKLKMI
ncbi:MAG: hypothetical protein AB1765_13135 [Candidatus Hydrogenedentota bacterium]